MWGFFRFVYYPKINFISAKNSLSIPTIPSCSVGFSCSITDIIPTYYITTITKKLNLVTLVV